MKMPTSHSPPSTPGAPPASHSTPSAPSRALSTTVTQVHLPPFSVIDAPTWFRRAEVQSRLKRSDAWSPRKRRHLSAIAEFNSTFRHLPVKKNPVVHALSRIAIDAVQLGLNYAHLATEKLQDPETAAVRTSLTALQWEDVPLAGSDLTILCNISTGWPWSVTPFTASDYMTVDAEICMARYLPRCRELGLILHFLPEIQSSSSHRVRHWFFSPTTEAFHLHPHGRRRSSSTIIWASLSVHRAQLGGLRPSPWLMPPRRPALLPCFLGGSPGSAS
ncbi:hypothetical protein E2C01_057480 [Portunus trituberculatus]|uniref:Uncharacterized protein n=1 Tax=Portunus trituberculatus TaxID=210409 RepID=A0A5B7GWX2_PORTR|nr:hypothetical protein [Portunus trituberculatus]